MSAGMYVMRRDGELVEMTEQAYESEDLLQTLLAQHSNLLAGDQIDPKEPRRWLLVTREAPVPSEEEGAGRWSLDHLFLDQDGVPTLVEVKRGSDTRIRREVVGQMLDYAANAVAYWPVESIVAQFEARCERLDRAPDSVLAEFLGQDADPVPFWQKVKTNLQAGRVRLVFVADEIPPELQRIVEFLNGQMSPAEVLAVEIRQYAGEQFKTLVPRVIGRTAEAERKKGGLTAPGWQWDERSFFDALTARPERAECETAKRIYDWAIAQALRMRWSRGQNGAFYLVLEHNGRELLPFAVRTGHRNAYVEIQFGRLKECPPFDEQNKRLELLQRLNQLPGVSISADALDKYPSLYLSALEDEQRLKEFFDTVDWVIQEIRSS